MRHKDLSIEPRKFWLLAVASSAAAAILSACQTPMPVAKAPLPVANAPLPVVQPPELPAPAPSSPVVGPTPAAQGSARSSAATTPRAYRSDAATHLYGLNADRIYKGKMPPLLYAIGVLNIEIDRAGRVTKLDWMRAPSHAPEVVAEIERTVRSAAPFPVPERMGRVVYTETWLWDQSGKFQLDTLTEGQN
jgi:hypothetical protein